VAVSLNGQQFTKAKAVHDPKDSVVYDYYDEPYGSIFYPRMGPNNGGTVVKIQGYNFKLARPHYEDKVWARFVDPVSLQPLSAPTEAVKDVYTHDAFNWVTPAVATP
jgi:hypothetical protein